MFCRVLITDFPLLEGKGLLQKLQLRLLSQSFKHNCHHLGSSFSTLPILIEIYHGLKSSDRVILSNGHSAPALYVALEHFLNHDCDDLFINMGDHPKRNLESGIFCSTGSLGMGITVAVGMAIAKPHIRVHCVISDGECSEGSVWESLRYAKQRNLENLEIYANINGWSAYDTVNKHELINELKCFYPRIKIRESDCFPFEEHGLNAHYIKLDESAYLTARKRICEKNL